MSNDNVVMSTFAMPDYIVVSRSHRILREDEIIEIDKFCKDNDLTLDMFKFQGTKTEAEYLAFNDPRDKVPVCMSINVMESLYKEKKIG